MDDRVTIKSGESRLVVERGRIARIVDRRPASTCPPTPPAKTVSILDIRVLGDPILREDTTPVGAISDDLRTLARDMFETMHIAKGIGLAAPQVGRSERLAVVEVDEHRLVIINPEVVHGEGKAKAEEGCLSIPDIYGDVERPAKVRVRATDLEGRIFVCSPNASIPTSSFSGQC